MRDFTDKIYHKLLRALISQNYDFQRFDEFVESNVDFKQPGDARVAIIRHDVDRKPLNSLRMAELEHEYGVKGTYYFRIVPESFNDNIISKIVNLGHEIGYHYEDIDIVARELKASGVTPSKEQIIDLAYGRYCENLKKIRDFADIKTICMHGSPRSPYDNKIVWTKYDYKSLGIIAEPYYDIDYDVFAYFTDTGRRWNGGKVSVRDKVLSKYDFNFRNTVDLINNVEKLPPAIILTIHPERWTNTFLPWVKEFFWQNLKNQAKKILIKAG